MLLMPDSTERQTGVLFESDDGLANSGRSLSASKSTREVFPTHQIKDDVLLDTLLIFSFDQMGIDYCLKFS